MTQNNNALYRCVYKQYIVDIEQIENESHNDFEMRKWYIFKNLHLTNEFVGKGSTAMCSLEELIHFSKIHIQKEIYNCKFDQKIMKLNDIFESNLYISY